ncbi:MAG: hypothetical protein JWM90_1199 [Thermoleophilia bacterium]|nr:hypothetical protein [Thermoleophilia bacterium]
MSTRIVMRIATSLAVVAVGAVALTACGGTSSSGGGGGSGSQAATVVPVKSNPISNTATTPGLEIASVLVENNVNPDTGKDAADHLEIALKNTATKPLDGFEIYYLIADPTSKTKEGYYTKLKPSFTIAPGATRIVHFDDTGATDHYPENKYSLYHASKNAMTIDVTASAAGFAPQMDSVKKDAGGAENPDE